MTPPSRRAVHAALAVVVALGAGGCSRAISGTAVAPPGAALAATRCGEYVKMPEAGRREVIAAIAADGNPLVEKNPQLWVGLAAALCTFTKPDTPVRQVISGGLR